MNLRPGGLLRGRLHPPQQPETIVARTPTRHPGRFILGRPRLTRISVVNVKDKIKTLRDYFVKEMKKEESSRTSSCLYVSRWEHYKRWEFLRWHRQRGDELATVYSVSAVNIQAAMLAQLTYQPPTSPESTLEPCAWHGRPNPMASPTAPPRALDSFSRQQYVCYVRLPVNDPGTWDTHTRRRDSRPARSGRHPF
ncbi:hypothetical protein HPB51_005064 [Rhipicephalus microplus]|uniref:MADF domain-containing protein n=1 Tax=Rhipicephalus microplus TaxID=6941 RepID=A0A9J6EXV3_RHIMP|nr:hypothetical protein HPB51_005064 [Rhipicephalus microplus]